MSSKKYMCEVARCNIAFIEKSAYLCCLTQHEGGGLIKLIDDYEHSQINWNEVFEKKQNILEMMDKGEIPPQCKGCSYLKNSDNQNKTYKFLSFNIAPFVPCNCRCTYCNIWKNPFQKEIEFVPIIKAMYINNLIEHSKDTFMSISGGEPLLIKDFEQLVYLSAQYGIHKFDVNSTGIKFSQAVADILKRSDKYMNFTVSIDSGNSDLYKKIKQVDCFDTVINNLKKYIKNQNGDTSQVRTKYIIIPNVNDNMENITEWYELSKDIGIKSVILDVEREWFSQNQRQLPKKYKELIETIKEKAKSDKISIGYYESLQIYMSRISAIEQ